MIEKISIENVDRAKVFNLGGFTVAGHKHGWNLWLIPLHAGEKSQQLDKRLNP